VNDDIAAAYRRARIDDQLGYYHDRRVEYEQASSAAAWLAGVFGAVTAAIGLVAALLGDGAPKSIAVVATVVPAIATALAGYAALYGFERLAKLYGDAEHALAGLGDVTPEAVAQAEEIMRREQGQWGQFAEEPPVTPSGSSG
jgi:type IV secretory pathway TrbL component